MACPTCAHTLHGLGGAVWWCPRCGTLAGAGLHYEAPKLVGRVKCLMDWIPLEGFIDGEDIHKQADIFGITEGIDNEP